MYEKFFLIIYLICFANSFVKASSSLQVKSLKCEHLIQPIGIDKTFPMLSWQLYSEERNQNQIAYEIMVGTDSLDLVKGKALSWKSGKIKSGESISISYKGKALKSSTRYFWKVRVYDSNNEVSEWSNISWWETGMVKENDWKACWIGDGSKAPNNDDEFYKDCPAPLFRKCFWVKSNIDKARLYISGLGYYEASLNGERIGNSLLDPGWTNYDKEVLYSSYDITSMIKTGNNCIGVMLGNGFYNPIPMPIFKNLREYLTIGQPCLKAQLHLTYTDGKEEIICSDESWKFNYGPIIRNNVYLGEKYDARKEIKNWDTSSFNDTTWKQAVCIKNSPRGKMVAQMQPPVCVKEIIKPIKMTETRKGEFVFDMGQNFAGVTRIRVKGPKGTKITIRSGEDVYSDGSLNVMTSVAGQHKTIWNADQDKPGSPQTAWQEDTYILKGEGEEIWNPRFTFHGFRYVEITGWPGKPTINDIEGLRLCSNLESSGNLQCSNNFLNRLYKVLDYTFLSNVFSVQSDCPAREKFGYGGDIVCVSRSFCYFYDMHNFYLKTIRDFKNDQRPSGGFTETAPYNGIGDKGLGEESGPIGWQLAYGFLQKQLYDYYGDSRVIKESYPTFKKQVDFLVANAKNFVIDRCINDHESLDVRIPALFATAHFYHHVCLIVEFANKLNKQKDVIYYTNLKNNIRQAFIDNFVNITTGKIGNGTPSEQAFGLFYQLIPKELNVKVESLLLKAINDRDYHITSGIFGVPVVLSVLNSIGRNDIAYRMVTQKTFPGWGYMLESGATTLWETWEKSDNVYSHNHPMFGSVGEWMYYSLAGIKPLSSGFKEFTICPKPVGDLIWSKSVYHSVRGDIICNWKIEDGKYFLKVVIPANTKANVFIPSCPEKIKEQDVDLSHLHYIEINEKNDKGTWLKIPSGSYEFSCNL